MTGMWRLLVCIFIGSGLGGTLRYLTSVTIEYVYGHNLTWALPWSTLLVNIAGCFIFGLIYGLSQFLTISEGWRLGLTTGLCGGLTTFSTFSYETLSMIQRGQLLNASVYTVISVAVGIAAAALGIMLVRLSR